MFHCFLRIYVMNISIAYLCMMSVCMSADKIHFSLLSSQDIENKVDTAGTTSPISSTTNSASNLSISKLSDTLIQQCLVVIVSGFNSNMVALVVEVVVAVGSSSSCGGSSSSGWK